MKTDDCYYFGIITRTVGYKGELDIFMDVDNPLEYNNLESVFVKLETGLIPYIIEKLQIKNNHATVRFHDVDNEMAMSLLKKELYLPLSLLPELKGNKFYFHEIKEFQVIDKQKGEIGIVKSVLDFPAQAVLQINSIQNKEILIPITDNIIINVDRNNKTISINAPEGLIDLYLD